MSCVHRYTVAVASGFLLLLCAAASGANAELEVELVSWTPDYGQPKPHTIVGKVTGAPGGSVPGDYKVASYVSVGSGWYNRPTEGTPTVALDSNWEFSVSLPFGNDHEADFFAMFVLDSSYLDTNVPATNGAHNLPQVMRDDALAFNMVHRGPQALEWSDHLWEIKEHSSKVGPGGNWFHRNNVEVDNDGLHLYIRPVADSPVNGEYASSEIINMNPLGYGTYLIQVRGAINRQDPVSVLGLFTWDTEGGAVAAPYRELDFEFSRWGNAADTTVGQFVVQPHGDAGNLQRFPLEGTTYDDASNPTEDEFTCIMVWGPNIVRWWVKEGLQDMDNWRDATDIAHLEYAGNTAVPDGGQAQWRINLWQYQNGNPAVEQHINIPSFQFQEFSDCDVPLDGVQCTNAVGPCEEAVCQPDTGTCGAETKPDGASCDDSDPATYGDECQAGVCEGHECTMDSHCNPGMCRGDMTCSTACPIATNPKLFRFNDNGVMKLVTDDCAAMGFTCTGATPTVTAGSTTYYVVGDLDSFANLDVCHDPPSA